MNWPVKGMDIYGIKNNYSVKEVKWSLTYDKDFYDLSLLFYELGYTLFNEILDDNTDHEKTDMCLYTAIMLIRQSIDSCPLFKHFIHFGIFEAIYLFL